MAKLGKEDIELNRKIAVRVKELRVCINQNQSKFAETYFIDRQLINRWESTTDNRGISIHTINRFCSMIDISLKEFFESEIFQ